MNEQQKLDTYLIHNESLYSGASAAKYANAFMHYALDNPDMPTRVKAMESWFAFAINSGIEIGRAQQKLREQGVFGSKSA